MSIIDGNPVNASYTNTRLISKIALAQSLIGTYNLNNPDSGLPVINLQQAINDIETAIDDALILISNNATNIQANTDSISDLINEIALGAKNIKHYATDTAYELDNVGFEGGAIYYNTTTGQLRYYDGIDLAWKPVGQEILGIQETIGLGDGSTSQFTITNAPLNDESILVFVNGRLIQKDLYTVNLPLIEFNAAPALGSDIYVWYMSEGSPASPIIASGTPVTIYKTVTAGEITAKEFILPSIPANPSISLVDFISGNSVKYGTEFIITGNIFSWDTLGLDGFIQANDELRIFYFT